MQSLARMWFAPGVFRHLLSSPHEHYLRRTKRMRKGITVLLFGMLALSAPPAANRLWGQAEKKDAMPDPAVKVGDMAPDLTAGSGMASFFSACPHSRLAAGGALRASIPNNRTVIPLRMRFVLLK